MRKFLIKFWAGFFILGWLGMTAWGFLYAETGERSVSSSRPNTYSSDELLIQFKSEIKLDPSQFLYPKLSSGLFQLDSLNSFFQLREIIPLIAFKKDYSTSIEQSTISQIYLFKFANVWSLSKLKKSYESLDIVGFVELNYHYFADHSKSKNSSSLLQLQLEEAARYLNPNHSVIIGTIDTGIDWQNQNLKANAWYNRLEKLDGKDNDANGFVDDLWGWNFVDEDLMSQFGFRWENHPIDYSGHGNQIAEIINQIVNYYPLNNDSKRKNQLMILKAGILSPDGKILFTAFASAQAIIYAADNGARVINLSWNGNFPSKVLQQAIDYAVNRGCVIISSAGDSDSSVPHYPAAYENVWAVTATNDDDKKLNGSNYGHWIDISAPGSTKENFSSSDSIQFIPSGTAIAAANISGLAGLLLSCENIVDRDSLKRRIIWSSENIYHKNPEYSGKLGAGRISVLRAINSQHQPNIIIPKLSSNLRNRAQYLLPVDIVPITISIKNLSSAAKDISIKLTTNDPYLTVLKSEITPSHLDFQQEFTNEFDPFTLIINNDCPPEHEAKLSVSITTSNGFSLEQSFTFTNLIILPENLTIINNSPMTLRWAAKPEFIGYHIYRKDDKQQTYAKIIEIPIVDSTFIDPTIKPGIQYFYYVTGIDSSGWESSSSNVVSIKLRPDLRFLFYPTQDTSIVNQDSIRFSALPQFNNVENYTYQWSINGERIFNDSNNNFIDSYLFKNSHSDTVTVAIANIELDTTITHRWIISLKNIIKKLYIKSVSPVSDTTLNAGDSLKFCISIENAENDLLEFQWQINDEVIEQERDSLFVLFSDSLSDSTNLVKVSIAKKDTAITYAWKVYIRPSFLSFDQLFFSPKSDTMIHSGDSIIFRIDPVFNDLTCQWLVNDKHDSLQSENLYIFHAPTDSSGTAIISVKIGIGDTAYAYEWNVDFESIPELAPSLYFFPSGDTTIYEDDSLNLVAQFAHQTDSLKNFQWQINGEVDSSTHQSNLVLTPDYFSAGIDTIDLNYELGDSIGSHQWLITILNRNRSPEILSHALSKDTTISIEDTLEFFVATFDPDQDSLSYRWYINHRMDTAAVDSFYTFFKIENWSESDTISVQISDNDTAIFHHWIVHYFAELNEIPQIISCSPSIDSMLTRADSILFNIHCNDPDGDTLRFTWSLNGWIDTSAHDSTYWYCNLDSTITNDTLNVIIADADTAIELEWILWTENFEPATPIRSMTYFPEPDSLIAEGDSLIFLVRNVNDSCRFQWKINSQIDSTANDSIFVYHPSQDSIATDTIHVTVFDQDSLFSHQWYIHYFNLTENQPSLPLRLAFKPEQDVIIASAEDKLKFSVQILEGEFADLNFKWSINKQLDITATDTIFYYNYEQFLTAPDTVQLIVSRGDTTISHQWILHFHQQQTLPVPHLIFPIEGNHICEDDKLIWENDSSFAQIDSTGDWNYVVQISSDTTFSTLISTDSCTTASIALNDLSGFERISIGKPIYWRVKVFSGYDKISEFNKCDLPFYYYPQFARLENFYGQKNEDGTIDLFWTTGYESNCAGFNVYRSESQDDNFEKVNEYLITGQTNYSFQDIKTNAGKTYYYKLEDVSLNGKKKFHHTISITTPIPAKFSLSQNYPNPFNAKTSFKYEIPTASRVKIEVCNILGRKVKTLVNEQKEAGFYTV